MDQHTIHIIEFLGIFLGGTIGLLKFMPQLRNIAIFFQIALFLTQLFGFYMKNNPDKQERLKRFVSNVINHYLETHPEGQEIARKSDIDERVKKFINLKIQRPETASIEHKNSYINNLFGIKVDNSPKKDL